MLTGSLRQLRSTQNKSISMTEHIKITAWSLSFTYNLICLMADMVSKVIDFPQGFVTLVFPHKQKQTLTLQSPISSVFRSDAI